jgi:hypothetical protein
MGDADADINIDYYDDTGSIVTAAHKEYMDVPPGASRLVVQFTDDPALGSGRYSAVVSADQPVAAIVNQQLIPSNATGYNPVPPFSTYSGATEGDLTVTLPAVMYNWYNYYTEFFVMNVGDGDANDVDITYTPGEVSGVKTGASGVDDLNNSIAQFATIQKSQLSMSSLGAPSGTYANRFLGSATITSDQPIVAVVNQHNTSAYKLLTYNGFSGGSTEIADPVHMRNYFGYYTTLLVANPNDTDAHVDLTYTPDTSRSSVSSGTLGPVTVSHTIPQQTALTRYDGPNSSDPQSDLDDAPVFDVFYGTVSISSDIPVVAQINVEALATGDGQAGSFNGIPVGDATDTIVVPVILADFYGGLYTTLVVQNTTGNPGSCDITYTSDDTYSAVTNQSKTYSHDLPANGSFTVYEGHSGGISIGDINTDSFWVGTGGQRYFLGAAEISCDVNAVAFVNEESVVKQKDSMYTFNTFNK